MSKALKIIGTVVAVAGLAVVTGGAALGLGLSLATSVGGISAGSLLLAGSLLSTAGSLLSPKPRAPQASEATADRLQVSIDLRTGRKIWFGSTAGSTDLRDQEYTDDQSVVHRFIVVASHKIVQVREIWFDDKLAWKVGIGAHSPYVDHLQVTIVTEGSAANAINISPRMGSSRRYTGCAYVYLRYKLNDAANKTKSPFVSGIPNRVTIVGDGAFLYDPRFDSSVPGGAGGQRAHDQLSWGGTIESFRNPALQMLWYLLGWRIENPVTGEWKLAVGKGIPHERIDLASFITAANLCDEPVVRANGSSEPRYRSDGVFSENDDPSLVLDNLKATMNAVLDDVDGKIRLSVLHNDLAAPIGALFTADVIGEFDWQQTPPLSDTINVIRGGYTDPSSVSLYQLVDAPEVRVDSPDGIDRIQTVNLPLVQSPSQWQRLAKQRLQRSQYGGSFTAVFQATAWKYQKGDVIRLSFYPLGFDRKLFRIADMAIQVDGLVPMVLREEHADIYAWDQSEVAAVQGAEPTSYDPTLWPLVRGIDDLRDRIDAIDLPGSFVFHQVDEPLAPPAKLNDLWLNPNGSVYIYVGDGALSELAVELDQIVTVDGEPVLFGVGGWALTALSEAVLNAGGNLYFLDDEPPVANKIGDSWFETDTGIMWRWDGAAWVATADRTDTVVATFPQIPEIQIATSYDGVPNSGQLPKSVYAVRFRGQENVSSSTDYTLTTSAGIVATINNVPDDEERGLITVTAAEPGKITVQSIRDDVTLTQEIIVSTSAGTAPGSDGEGAGSVVRDDTLAWPSDSFVFVPITNRMKAVVGSSGEVELSLVSTFQADTQTFDEGQLYDVTAAAKWMMSADGVSGWTDVAPASASTRSAYNYFRNVVPKGLNKQDGLLNAKVTATAVPPGAYWFRAMAVNTSASSYSIASFMGAATVRPL